MVDGLLFGGVCVVIVLFERDGFYVAKDNLQFMILLLLLPKHCVVFQSIQDGGTHGRKYIQTSNPSPLVPMSSRKGVRRKKVIEF